MSDGALVQLLLVAGAALVVVGAALATRGYQRPTHAKVDIAGSGLPSGIVLFTSTDCATCKDALATVRSAAVPVSDVTWELEGQLFERAGVTAVPLVLVIDESGSVIDQIVGVPRRRRLARAVSALRGATPR